MTDLKLTKKQQQALALLDRNLQLVREFMNDWLLFNQVFSAYASPGANKAELEAQFLKVKCKLAREHQVLKEGLGPDYKLSGNTMGIVQNTTSLESIHGQSDIAVKKLQSEWHRAFISLNETLGAMEDKRNRLLAGEKVFVGVDNPGAIAKGRMSESTKKTLIVIVVVIIIMAVMFFVPPIRNMYKEAFNDLFG